MKTLVWIIGGGGSGKTTQSKMLIEAITNQEKPESVIGNRVYYTVYPDSELAVLGKVGRNQCTGLDSVYNELGSEGIGVTLKSVIKDDRVSLIIAECVFGSTKWYQNWIDIGIRFQLKVLLIHLDSTLWNSYKRISQRRAKKLGREDWWEIPLEDTVYKNVGNKNKETKVIYDKLTQQFHKPNLNTKVKVDDAIQIDFTKSEQEIHEEILTFIEKNL